MSSTIRTTENNSRLWLLSLGTLLCAFGPMQGAIVTTGCAGASSCTMAELASGGTITVNGIRFSNFEITDALRDPGSPPQESEIIVQGLDDGGFDPGPGLRYLFDDELTLASGGVQNMTFRFNFTAENTLGAATLIGHTLDMVDFINAGNPGAVEGQLNVRDQVETIGGAVLDTALVESVRSDAAMVNILNNPDIISFAVQNAIRVRTTVNGTTLHQLALETLDQRFSIVVPEPDTATLLSCGIAIVIAGLRLRRRR
jgi:hypothetical protein